MPTALRRPVTNRCADEKRWPVLLASNFQMPARVFNSVHGFTPGDWSVRFFTWQEFEADPTSM